MTRDIDANWIGTPPSMKTMENEIKKALDEMNEKFEVKAFREYGEGRSAGFKICDKSTGDKILSMDIDIRPSIGYRLYYYGKASIKGVLANDIIADKISAMSTDAIYKHRAKDLVDIYALTHCIDIDLKDIYEICDRKNRRFQSFDAFFNRKPEIEHAYDRLKGVERKPDFSQLYEYLSKFIRPFAESDRGRKVWDSKKSSWEDERQLETRNANDEPPPSSKSQERPSLLAALKAAKPIADEHNQAHSLKNKEKDKDQSL